jgi:hypothetical protein
MRFWPGDGVYVTGSTLFVAFQEIENRAWIFRRYREQESYPDLFSYLPHLINFFFNVFESHRNCFSDQIPNVTRERIAFFDSKSTDTGEKIDCPTAQFSQKESQVKEIWSFYRHIANKSCLSHMWTDFLAIFDRILFQKYLISFVQATKSAAVFYCALTFWAGCPIEYFVRHGLLPSMHINSMRYQNVCIFGRQLMLGGLARTTTGTESRLFIPSWVLIRACSLSDGCGGGPARSRLE